jgi:hypothetical protein
MGLAPNRPHQQGKLLSSALLGSGGAEQLVAKTSRPPRVACTLRHRQLNALIDTVNRLAKH